MDTPIDRKTLFMLVFTMRSSAFLRGTVPLLLFLMSSWCLGQQKEGADLLIAFSGPLSTSEMKRAFQALEELDPSGTVSFSNSGSLAKYRRGAVNNAHVLQQALLDAGFTVTIVQDGGSLPWSLTTKSGMDGGTQGTPGDPSLQEAAKQSWIEANPETYQRLIEGNVQRTTSP